MATSTQPIEHDLNCAKCNSNLRGLRRDAGCPKCGETVQASLKARLAARRKLIRDMQAPLAVQQEGIYFVLDALRNSLESGMLAANPFTARNVCVAFAEWTSSSFPRKEDGPRQLIEWGIQSSEDLGRVVQALIDGDVVKGSPDLRFDDFAGIFKLSRRAA
jgi:uncharacterized repeat protein (TIGR04138 family)